MIDWLPHELHGPGDWDQVIRAPPQATAIQKRGTRFGEKIGKGSYVDMESARGGAAGGVQGI